MIKSWIQRLPDKKSENLTDEIMANITKTTEGAHPGRADRLGFLIGFYVVFDPRSTGVLASQARLDAPRPDLSRRPCRDQNSFVYDFPIIAGLSFCLSFQSDVNWPMASRGNSLVWWFLKAIPSTI